MILSGQSTGSKIVANGNLQGPNTKQSTKIKEWGMNFKMVIMDHFMKKQKKKKKKFSAHHTVISSKDGKTNERETEEKARTVIGRGSR